MIPSPLEPTEEEWQHWTTEIVNFLRQPPPPSTKPAVIPPIPEHPLPGGLPKILELFAAGLHEGIPTADPGYLAYVPGGGIYSAALANFLGNTTNGYTGIYSGAPTLVELENHVGRWLCREFGLPDTSAAVFTSGGSIANLSAIIAARARAFGDSGDFSKARLYVSDQAHHSILKAGTLAGIPYGNCVSIPTDENYRMGITQLQEQITIDRTRGLAPFLVIATAGTTNTGAVDPLPELAEICRREGLWLHIDAAYGGAFVLCPEGRRILQGIEQADSTTFDPHKGMFLPYGTGCLLVRERAHLLRVNHFAADYFAEEQHDAPAHLGMELSREYRGIRLWLPLLLHGAAAFRTALSEKLELTQWLYGELQKLPVQLLNHPELSTIVFRPGDICAKVNSYGRVYLAPTQLRGVATSRVCVLSFRTHAAQMEACLADIRRAVCR